MNIMQALVKTYAKPGLWMETVPVPVINTNEVLIKVEKTGICGTDLHIYNWDEWAARHIPTSRIIGHEFVGHIVDIGPGVQGYQVGDRVTAEGHITCNICRNCRAGKTHLCDNAIGIGGGRDGAFAEYIAMPATNLWPVHPDISSELAAIMDPFGNAVHCALSFDLVGEDVLITGAGPIGIMAAAVCRFIGARHVVITDINDDRLKLAQQFGVTRTVNVQQENIMDILTELNMSNGFDVGLEMSGNETAFNSMINAMHHGGHIALLGFLPAQTTISWDQVIFKGLHLKGIYGREMYETWYKMTQLLRSGLDISPIITHRFHAKDFQQGFDKMKQGHCGKVILEWDSV